MPSPLGPKVDFSKSATTIAPMNEEITLSVRSLFLTLITTAVIPCSILCSI